MNNKHLFDQKTIWIRARVSAVLTKWGLLPRFKRWRLTQDPETGMIVLFGILNNRYIAMHTSIPFSDYFEPRLLHDLANALQMQVVSCNSDGLRYAFILERGSLVSLPTHIEYPYLEGEKVFVRVVVADERIPEVQDPPVTPIPLVVAESGGEQAMLRQGVKAFLKVLDDIERKDIAAAKLAAQELPDMLVIDKEEFNKRVAEQKAHQESDRVKQLWQLFEKKTN